VNTITTWLAPGFIAMIVTGVVVGKKVGRVLWCSIVVATGCTGMSVCSVIWAMNTSAFLQGYYSFLALVQAFLAWLVWREIWRRRKRRRLRKLIGAKARLIRDKMVKRIREQKQKPRLRQVPQPV
jgi:hypothetical protein